ncbi:unnamed protein product, partial [Mesorhabditis belari]|uniref:Guanine nucleotide-binding protein-like 3 homolog n=1 Tax=Mesorhabditis belari TaxID=2138241 RepID=A0AAF3EY52_9BILA
MAKLCLKKASKRKSFAKQYKIQKKVKEHNKKSRKEARLQKQKGKAAKPIAVPNSCPFKEEILLEAEKAREALEQQREARKEAARALEQERKAGKRKLVGGGLDDLVAKAAKEEKQFAKGREAEEEFGKNEKLADKSVKVYAAEVRKTIETADIIIEVLDARDPLGSRSKTVEEQVVNSGKRLVLLLNKIDLVPKENVIAWLKYLRLSFPTIAFKASTQEQNSKLGRFGGSNLSNSFSAKCIGADLVMKLLGNYCRNKDIKTSIRVGLVGYPNVGKSSVINSLKRKRACNVGATPGVTKQIQEVELDKNIRLLDSPGVVLATKSQVDTVEVALKNAIRVENLADPVSPVQAILRRCTKETLMLHYVIADFSSCEHFLALVARKLGRLKKGGVPDINAAARHVLNDWNSGRLRYYTQPPEQAPVNENLEAAQIVAQFSKEFDIDALEGDLQNLVEDLPMDSASDVATTYKNDGPAPTERWGDEESDDDDMEMDQQGGKTIVVAKDKKPKRSDRETNKDLDLPESLALGGNVQLNRSIKKAVKKQKKNQKKTTQRADALADAMDIGLSTKQDDYDFSMA